ncbi:MAG: hypothetical protein FH761_16680 [Firmicutes bacterium]|nr:hypothetical protein [Bacillota bacterium]
MFYASQIIGIDEKENGTHLHVLIPNEKVRTKILNIREGKSINSEIRIDDNRTITALQRKKIYATIRDICDYTGDIPEYMKEFFKFDYCSASGQDYFSLSDCSVTTARLFINHIIEFVIKEGIPLSELAIERTDDISSYLYYCLMYRKCCITGTDHADIHHCVGSKVGMGNNRRKISNKGRKLIALNRELHTLVESEGEGELFKAYKVYGIEVDDEGLKKLKLSEKDIT